MNKEIVILDLITKQQELLAGHTESVIGMVICPERNSFVSCDADGLLIFWDTISMKAKHKVSLNHRVLKLEKKGNFTIKLYLENKQEMVIDWNGIPIDGPQLINEFPKRYFKLVLNKKRVSERDLFFFENP